MKISGKKIRNLWYGLRRNFNKDILVNRNARGNLKFGICLFNRFTLSDKNLQIMGDELEAKAIAREVLTHCPEVAQCRIYDIKEADKIKDDIVFVMWPSYPPLKTHPKKYIMWLQNAGFEADTKKILRDYDYIFSASKQCCNKFKNIIYLPAACEDTELFKKTPPDKKFESDVCFIGNYSKQNRPTWLQKDFMLPATKYNFGLWGNNWDYSEIKNISSIARGRIEARNVPTAYSSSKIVLSIHSILHRQEDIIVTRIYEALACEAFIISDWFEALDEFKNYLIFTSGGKDLEEKLDYYLAHPEKREEKIRGARDFIIKNHTFKNRVKTIANTIGLEFKE